MRALRTATLAAFPILFATRTAPAGADEGGDNGPITIRVATPFAPGQILAVTADKFKEILEQKYPGQFQVTVAKSVLNEQAIDPAMQNCDPAQRVADIAVTGGQPIADWAPAYGFVNGPYVLKDFSHFQAVWRSDLGVAAADLIKTNGNVVVLEPVYRGFRQFTSNKPIHGPADFVGLKLRLPAIPDWVAVWSSLGATIVQVPLNSLYDALKSGRAEASEGDLTQITSLKLYQVQTDLTLTSHLVGFGLPLANACFLQNELNEGQRQKVLHAMEDASDFATKTIIADEPSLIAQLQAAGMTVVTPDAASIRAAAKPAIDHLFATEWTVTTWAAVLKLAN